MKVNFEEKNKYCKELGYLVYGDFFLWEGSLYLTLNATGNHSSECFNFMSETFRELDLDTKVEPVKSSELEMTVRR